MNESPVAHIKWKAISAAFTAVLLSIPTAASGYETWPLKNTHEAMTLLAQQCMVDARDLMPMDCRAQFGALRRLTPRRGLMGYDDLQVSVRWADDPARQVPTSSLFRFLYNMKGGSCERRTARRAGVIPRIDQAGLLCSSHYGRLQFFHAQTSYEDGQDETRAKIIDWAVLAYQIAVGELSPSIRICDHFQRRAGGIADSFELGVGQCDQANARAWTFATLLASRCPNPVSADICPQMPTAAGTNALAVRTALGAVLHLIQDSYSQSHAARGPVHTRRDRYDNRVDCSLPSLFYSFRGQDGHGTGDRVPYFAPNCQGDETDADDVITASAMVLHLVAKRTPSAQFSCYLQERVFGRRPQLPGETPPALCPSGSLRAA